jgi:hypothetical protein
MHYLFSWPRFVEDVVYPPHLQQNGSEDEDIPNVSGKHLILHGYKSNLILKIVYYNIKRT